MAKSRTGLERRVSCQESVSAFSQPVFLIYADSLFNSCAPCMITYMIQDHMESIEKEKVILTVPKFIFSDDGFSQK